MNWLELLSDVTTELAMEKIEHTGTDFPYFVLWKIHVTYIQRPTVGNNNEITKLNNSILQKVQKSSIKSITTQHRWERHNLLAR